MTTGERSNNRVIGFNGWSIFAICDNPTTKPWMWRSPWPKGTSTRIPVSMTACNSVGTSYVNGWSVCIVGTSTMTSAMCVISAPPLGSILLNSCLFVCTPYKNLTIGKPNKKPEHRRAPAVLFKAFVRHECALLILFVLGLLALYVLLAPFSNGHV